MSSSQTGFSYSGNELETFSAATNWKAYWSSQIEHYLGQDVLELGAGLGATAKTLNHRRYNRWLGLEPDKTMCTWLQSQLDQGQLPMGYQIRNGTSVDLAPDDQFDTILYIDVLEHIENDREELERASTHLVSGGYIIIVAPAHNFLFTDFDKKIGHFRRYDKRLLNAIVPSPLQVKTLHYLDSVGMLASLANKLVLKSDTPSAAQIKFWDALLVRASRWIDLLTRHKLGKSIVCILEKKSPAFVPSIP